MTFDQEIYQAQVNLSELLAMKNPDDYTTVESSLTRFQDWYFKQIERA